MKAQIKQKTVSVALISLIMGFTACKCPTTFVHGPPGFEPCPPDETANIVIHPTGNGGTLNALVQNFSSGDAQQGCFPFSQGWDRYYSTGYFLGPNVSPLPSPNNYPNPTNFASVTIDTEATLNGPTLDTGIVIMEDTRPYLKVCNDNDSAYTSNTKLSKVTFNPTVTGKKYRAVIFYKSSTLGGLTNVVVHWNYP